MSLIFKSIISLLLFINFSTHSFSSEKIFNVVINEPSSDERAIAFVDTVTGKNRILEVNMNGEVIWEWNFPSKLVNKVKNICNGADINYLKSTDEFLFILPKEGAFIVGRDRKYRSVVKDNLISHDIDILPNGNFIYARGWANKGEDEVREVSPSGKVVWKWSHAKYFPDRDDYLKDLSKRGKKKLYRDRTFKTDDIDWAHVNGVEQYSNGDTLISLRNFRMFVIVESNGRPKKIFRNIHLVHEPHRTEFGYIAADRFLKRGYLLHSIIIINKEDDDRKYLLKGKFKTVRGIEQLNNNRFNITSSGNVLEIDVNGKVFHRMHLTFDKEDAERNLHGRDLKERRIKKLNKGRCAGRAGNLYKVVKTKFYK
jgi:hypothetical protein